MAGEIDDSRRIGELVNTMKPDDTVSRTSVVTLREVTEATLGAILRLKVSEAQERFVASNAVSIAQAHFSRRAWFRAIYADETPVGFVMLSDDPEKPEYFLWRFMIDARFQRLGFGRQAIERVVDHVKTRPAATVLFTSCVEGEGSPKSFYESLGFVANGTYDEGEAVMALKLSTGDS